MYIIYNTYVEYVVLSFHKACATGKISYKFSNYRMENVLCKTQYGERKVS